MLRSRWHISATKGPGCTCCDKWAEHLRAYGFSVSVTESSELDSLKATLGVPARLRTCHTARVGPYILEGHVPAPAIWYVLRHKPRGMAGLAVPGMPIGSPGMETDGVPAEEYRVIMFGPTGRQLVWARFKGATEVVDTCSG
jgi:hypothetical protein